MLRATPQQSETMHSAFDDQSSYEDDGDSPTEPMIPVILAPHTPAPTNAASAVEPTAPLPPLSHSFQSTPEIPGVYPLLPPLSATKSNGRPPGGAAQPYNGLSAYPASPVETGIPTQPRRSPVPTVVGVCFVIVQVLLLLRVILLLFNVSSGFAWARVLYDAGGIFALPFRLLLDHIQLISHLGPGVSNYLAPLAAILIYGLVSRILVRFLKALLNSR